MWRLPSSYCFVRAWGNDTAKLIAVEVKNNDKPGHVVCIGNTCNSLISIDDVSNPFFAAGRCNIRFSYDETHSGKCLGVSSGTKTKGQSKNDGEKACDSFSSSDLFKDDSQWCQKNFRKFVLVSEIPSQ